MVNSELWRQDFSPCGAIGAHEGCFGPGFTVQGSETL